MRRRAPSKCTIRGRRSPARQPDVYNVDHSSLLYVLDRNWRTVSIIQTMNRVDPMDPSSPLVPVAPESHRKPASAAGLERTDLP
jgi:hypothetical protein